jgi:hypothetical protein
MAEIVAKRLVEHLERAGFVVMKRPPEIARRRWGGDLRTLDHREMVWPLCAIGLYRSRGRGGERAEGAYG